MVKPPTAKEVRDDLAEAMKAIGMAGTGNPEDAIEKFVRDTATRRKGPVATWEIIAENLVADTMVDTHIAKLVAAKRILRLRKGWYIPACKKN